MSNLTISTKLVNRFKKEVFVGPSEKCMCCGCLHFRHSLSDIKSLKLNSCTLSKETYQFLKDTTFICHRCLGYVHKIYTFSNSTTQWANVPKNT